MFKYDDHIMGIQGHPEYSKDLLLHLIDRLIQKNFIMVCLFSCLIVVFYFLAHSD
jgi:GMP synthase-like glutamine amidotransferase